MDAVYICSPVDYHREHVLAAAQAGKPVLVEKPMAASSIECREMIEACRARDVALGVAYMMRYRPQIQIARRMLEEGRLGAPVFGRAQNTFWYPDSSGAWRQEPLRSRGGVLWDVGSHAIDTLRYLLGEVQEVNGLTGSAHFAYPVEDTALATLRFASGALGIIDVSWAVPYRQCPLEIYGTQGSLMVERGLGPFQNPVMHLLDEKGSQEIPIPPGNAYTAEFEAVSQAILEGKEPEVSGLEGLYITQILEAIYRSAEKGEPVRLIISL